MKYYFYYIDTSKINRELENLLISEYDNTETDKYDEQIIKSKYVLYGWTKDKKMGKEFLLYRREDLFAKETTNLDKEDGKEFEKIFCNFELKENNYATRGEYVNGIIRDDTVSIIGPIFEYNYFEEYMERILDKTVWNYFADASISLLEIIPKIVSKDIQKAFEKVGWLEILDAYSFVLENGYWNVTLYYDEWEIYLRMFSELFV